MKKKKNTRQIITNITLFENKIKKSSELLNQSIDFNVNLYGNLFFFVLTKKEKEKGRLFTLK